MGVVFRLKVTIYGSVDKECDDGRQRVTDGFDMTNGQMVAEIYVAGLEDEKRVVWNEVRGAGKVI